MFLQKIRAVLIDLSGTIHVDDKSIPGAVQAIEKLKTSGLPVTFATNTTKESRLCLLTKLRSMGFKIGDDQIFTSLVAARQLVQKDHLKPYLMLEEAALPDFEPVCDVNLSLEKSDSIVIGLAPKRFNYEEMNRVFNALQSGQRRLIAIHKSRYYETKNGLAIGPGAFVSALEYSSAIKSQVVGKPDASFFLQAIAQMGDFSPDQVAMIGDDVRDDVGGAQAAGMIGMLVRTGKFRNGDEKKIQPEPNLVFDSVVEAINHILAHNDSCSQSSK